MQVALKIRQARLRANRRESFHQHARQLGAVVGELLALASLAVALTAGLTLLTGLIG